jgi:transcriptional regulator with XRE-family HTH domain
MPRVRSREDMKIGVRIRALREEVGLTQSGLGELLGLTFQQIQKYEKGTNRVSSSSLIVIAKALNTTPSVLIGEKEPADWEPEEFNLDAYRLARSLSALPPPFRKAVDHLIQTMNDHMPKSKK